MEIRDFLAEHPVNRARVEEHGKQMLAEVRAYRLRELHEHAGLTQEQLAAGIGDERIQVARESNLSSAPMPTLQ